MKKKKFNQQPKIRLVLILSVFPQRSETFIISKFLGLLSRGWDVHVYCRKLDRNAWALYPELDQYPGIKKKIQTSWPINPRWLAAILFPFALIRCLAHSPKTTWRYLRNAVKSIGWGTFKQFYLDAPLICLQPDIVHFEFGALAIGQAHLKDCLNARLSVSFRGYDLNFVGIDNPEHFEELWQVLDGCHLLSKHLWQRAQVRGCPEDMTHEIIPPAINLDSFPDQQTIQENQIGTENHPLRILSIGRLEWKKGYEHALKAVRILLDRNVLCKYQIIGSGQYEAALFYARKELGLEEVVEFSGSKPHSQVIDDLYQADILLHPSLSEGFCNAVLEAQAAGLPVVCTDAGGLPENVKDGVTGFVVPRRDPKAIADKLAQLAADSTLRKRMGAAGRKRIEAQFGMDQQLDAFEGFYEQL